MLRGLGEHWGRVDETLNPDLDDIAAAYADGYFAVARCRGALVGAGGFLPVSSAIVQIHRMSVDATRRRQGIGSALLAHLIEVARTRGFERAMLETTATWHEVVAFWERRGFARTVEREGDQYFERRL